VGQTATFEHEKKTILVIKQVWKHLLSIISVLIS